MEKTCNQYTFEQISEFVDNELPQQLMTDITRHCEKCVACQRTVDQLASISDVFLAHVSQKVAAMDTSGLDKTMDNFRPGDEKTVFGNIFGMLGQHLYLKLSFITAILMIGLFTFNTTFMTPSGPSAIVKYVDTEMPSVMIFETEKQKHTIIWFTET